MASRTRKGNFTSQFFVVVAMLAFAAIVATPPAYAQMEHGFTWSMPIKMEQIERNPVIVTGADVLLADGKTRVGSYSDTSGEEFVVPYGITVLDIEGLPVGLDPRKVDRVGITFDWGRHFDYASNKNDWLVRVDTKKYAAGRKYRGILMVEGDFNETRVKFFFLVVKFAAHGQNFGMMEVMFGDPSRDTALDATDPIEVYLHCRGVTPAWTTAAVPAGFSLEDYRRNKAAFKAQPAGSGGSPSVTVPTLKVPVALTSVPVGVKPQVWQRAQVAKFLPGVIPVSNKGQVVVVVSKPDGSPAPTFAGKKTRLSITYLNPNTGQWQVLEEPRLGEDTTFRFPVTLDTRVRVQIKGANGPPLEATVTPGDPTYFLLEVK